jgi:hypothetical protein
MSTVSERPAPTSKGCWYFITITECVLCGRGDEDRERRTDPRPEDWKDRHRYVQDACGEHFV